jgi:hypothetical protein
MEENFAEENFGTGNAGYRKGLELHLENWISQELGYNTGIRGDRSFLCTCITRTWYRY